MPIFGNSSKVQVPLDVTLNICNAVSCMRSDLGEIANIYIFKYFAPLRSTFRLI